MRVLGINKYIFYNYDYLFPLSLFLNMLTEKDGQDKERNIIIINTIYEEKNSLADKYHLVGHLSSATVFYQKSFESLKMHRFKSIRFDMKHYELTAGAVWLQR